MKKTIFLIVTIIITMTLLLIGLQFTYTKVWSQGKPMPGPTPIKSQEDAIAAGITQASFYLAKGATGQEVTLKEATRLDPSGYKSTLAKYGAEDNLFETQQKSDVWEVVFSGRFTPKDLVFPAGTIPKIPVYKTLEIYLSADNGIPIHIRMYDQISPPQ
jgi:hypothetical protein